MSYPFFYFAKHGRPQGVATFPDSYGNWRTLLEGGIFLPLADDFEAGLSKLNSMHIGQWTVGEVEEILLNPIYAFGYYYQHIDLICDWFYVFLYGLATTQVRQLLGKQNAHKPILLLGS